MNLFHRKYRKYMLTLSVVLFKRQLMLNQHIYFSFNIGINSGHIMAPCRDCICFSFDCPTRNSQSFISPKNVWLGRLYLTDACNHVLCKCNSLVIRRRTEMLLTPALKIWQKQLKYYQFSPLQIL